MRIDYHNLERYKQGEIELTQLLRSAWESTEERKFVMDLILFLSAGWRWKTRIRVALWFAAGMVAGAIALASAQTLGIL